MLWKKKEKTCKLNVSKHLTTEVMASVQHSFRL